MKRIIFPAILALLASRLASAQGASALLPSTLPSCAGQCTVLQQAATGCTPAGGAPVANQATYQSCFCQSALLPSLFSTTAVQLCSTCSASDMASIQSWYKNLCGKGAGVANSPDSPSSTSAAPSASKATGKSSTTPTSGASVSNSQGNTSSTDQTSNGPWYAILPILLSFCTNTLTNASQASNALQMDNHAHCSLHWSFPISSWRLVPPPPLSPQTRSQMVLGLRLAAEYQYLGSWAERARPRLHARYDTWWRLKYLVRMERERKIKAADVDVWRAN